MASAIESGLRRAGFAVVVHTEGLEIREWNVGAERLFGFSAEEAVGKHLPSLIGTKDSPKRKDGSRLACVWQEEKLDDGTVLALVTDVTASKTQERILRTILDNLEIVVWQVDSAGIFNFHDGRKVLEKVGLKPGQVVGMDAMQLYSDSAWIIRDALGGKSATSTTELMGLAWQNWYVPVYDADGKIDGAAGISLNVTDSHAREAELRAKLALIETQQNTIREMSTPLIETWEGVLTVPMLGVVDTVRASEVMEQLLTEITRRKSKFAIVDLTGVDVVDTAVAGHIVRLARSIQLLGAEAIVTGIRPQIAQTIVHLGVDLTGVRTLANLREALRYAIGRLNQGDV